MSAPKRIQRKRTKGWRMPEGVVYVGRPSKWGNPFKVGKWFRKITADWKVMTIGDKPFGDTRIVTLNDSLDLFKEYATARVQWDKEWLVPLRCKTLACWCREGGWCHADTLLELANQ